VVRGWECWRVLNIGVYLHFAKLPFCASLVCRKNSRFETYVQLAPLHKVTNPQTHQKGQLPFSHASILSRNSLIRSSIHPDTIPRPAAAALPSLGSTFVRQTPSSRSKEYCLHSSFLTQTALQASTESNLPSSSFSLKFSHPARGAIIICGMTRSAKTSLWRSVSETLNTHISSQNYEHFPLSSIFSIITGLCLTIQSCSYFHISSTCAPDM
jgi:hypothetical protein